MNGRIIDTQYLEWSRAVKRRDNFRCQICGSSEKLHSHHLNSWNYFIDERFVVENGMTLCNYCHLRFHSIYGKGYNTRYQFEQFKELIVLLHKIAKESK